MGRKGGERKVRGGVFEKLGKSVQQDRCMITQDYSQMIHRAHSS